jgi:hypothetical protein
MIVRVNKEDALTSNAAANVRYHPASAPQTQKLPPSAHSGRSGLVCIFILPQNPVIWDGLIGVHVGDTLTGVSLENLTTAAEKFDDKSIGAINNRIAAM